MKRSFRMQVFFYVMMALVVFFAVNVIATHLLNRYQLDLSEEKLFTLSDGSMQLLQKNKEPITLRLFYSNTIANGIPVIKSYAMRIKGLLEEYARQSDGRVTVEIIDPEPFSREEDLAVSYGLQGVQLDDAGTKLYFGLVATNSVDDMQSIPFLHFDREPFVEYDISRMIYDLSLQQRPVIGLLSSIEMTGTAFMNIPGIPAQPDWVVLQQLKSLFTLKEIDPEAQVIDAGIDVLMVVQPEGYSDDLLYAIDQYILGGGKAVFFLDPNKEGPGTGNPGDRAFSKNINELMKPWGVEVDPDIVIADRLLARNITPDSAHATGHVRYLASLQLTPDVINQQEMVAAKLQLVNLSTSGYVKVHDLEKLTVTPVFTSSSQAMQVNADRIRVSPDADRLLRDFKAENQKFPLAVRIHGNAETAFPDRAAGDAGHLTESTKPIEVVVVADTDLLRDQMWLRQYNFQGYDILQPIADNASFFVNLADYYSGSRDLIQLRGRNVAKRRFHVVDDLRSQAEEKFLVQEQQLQEQLVQTEQRLATLQKKGQEGNSLVYQAEQQKEIERFSEQLLKLRTELRNVQHQLNDTIERLGSWLKFINIVLMPLMITIFALGFYGVIHRRRKRLP